MEMGLTKGFAKTFKNRIEGYHFEVGILDDKAHKQPVVPPRGQAPELKSYAGGPARKVSTKDSGLTIGQVLQANMERMNINILLRPFQDKNSDLIKFMKEFFQMAIAKSSTKRCENLLQAVVRNPILKQEYGKNSAHTADDKGFDRKLIDTSQMFQAIKAKVSRV